LHAAKITGERETPGEPGVEVETKTNDSSLNEQIFIAFSDRNIDIDQNPQQDFDHAYQ
jgi:hypothetical protein